MAAGDLCFVEFGNKCNLWGCYQDSEGGEMNLTLMLLHRSLLMEVPFPLIHMEQAIIPVLCLHSIISCLSSLM